MKIKIVIQQRHSDITTVVWLTGFEFLSRALMAGDDMLLRHNTMYWKVTEIQYPSE